MQIRLSDLYKIMGGYDVEGNRTIAPEILQWLTSVQQQTTPETTYTQDGPSTTNETTYTFDKTFGNEFGEAPIGPDGQPLWIPDEQRSVGRTLGRMAATLGGAAVLGNAALIASAVGSLGVSAPAAEAATAAAGASTPSASAIAGAVGIPELGLIATPETAAAAVAGGVSEAAVGAGSGALSGAAQGALSTVSPLDLIDNYRGLSGTTGTTGTEGSGYPTPASTQGPGGSPVNGVPTGYTGAISPAPGTPGAPGGSSGQSVLEQIMGGNLTPDALMRLLSGGLGAYQQYNFGQDMLDRANAATPNRDFYEGELKRSYTDPGSYLKGPDVQAGMDLTLQKLQSRDAAGGRLANDIGRQTTLSNYAFESLNKYRTGLAGIVGDNQRTYSGQNQTFQQGAQADNSYLNSILNAFSSRTGT